MPSHLPRFSPESPTAGRACLNHHTTTSQINLNTILRYPKESTATTIAEQPPSPLKPAVSGMAIVNSKKLAKAPTDAVESEYIVMIGLNNMRS